MQHCMSAGIAKSTLMQRCMLAEIADSTLMQRRMPAGIAALVIELKLNFSFITKPSFVWYIRRNQRWVSVSRVESILN